MKMKTKILFNQVPTKIIGLQKVYFASRYNKLFSLQFNQLGEVKENEKLTR
jgi:hypothetical protein